MKTMIDVTKWISLAALIAVLPACTIEPIQSEPVIVVKGAPDWVNKGSRIMGTKEGRLFHGVSSANPQGDLALQKSISDDRSVAEVARILASYLGAVANDYTAAARYGDEGGNDDAIYRKIDDDAVKQVKDSVARQIDEAIARQFKESVSPQFKEEMARQIKVEATRQIRTATAAQIDFSRQFEETISNQIKRSVAHQIKNTTKANFSSIKIIGSWRDPNTNTIWSISELDLTNVKKTVSEISDMNVELKSYFEVNAEAIFDRIIRERDNPNPFAISNSGSK